MVCRLSFGVQGLTSEQYEIGLAISQKSPPALTGVGVGWRQPRRVASEIVSNDAAPSVRSTRGIVGPRRQVSLSFRIAEFFKGFVPSPSVDCLDDLAEQSAEERFEDRLHDCGRRALMRSWRASGVMPNRFKASGTRETT